MAEVTLRDLLEARDAVRLNVLSVWPERGPDGWDAWLEMDIVEERTGNHHVLRFGLTAGELAGLCDDAQTTALTLLTGRAPEALDAGDVTRRLWED